MANIYNIQQEQARIEDLRERKLAEFYFYASMALIANGDSDKLSKGVLQWIKNKADLYAIINLNKINGFVVDPTVTQRVLGDILSSVMDDNSAKESLPIACVPILFNKVDCSKYFQNDNVEPLGNLEKYVHLVADVGKDGKFRSLRNNLSADEINEAQAIIRNFVTGVREVNAGNYDSLYKE